MGFEQTNLVQETVFGADLNFGTTAGTLSQRAIFRPSLRD